MVEIQILDAHVNAYETYLYTLIEEKLPTLDYFDELYNHRFYRCDYVGYEWL